MNNVSRLKPSLYVHSVHNFTLTQQFMNLTQYPVSFRIEPATNHQSFVQANYADFDIVVNVGNANRSIMIINTGMRNNFFFLIFFSYESKLKLALSLPEKHSLNAGLCVAFSPSS